MVPSHASTNGSVQKSSERGNTVLKGEGEGGGKLSHKGHVLPMRGKTFHAKRYF